jgi:hypothetical protein
MDWSMLNIQYEIAVRLAYESFNCAHGQKKLRVDIAQVVQV